MNESLKDKLRVLSEDRLTLEALKAIIGERIEMERPTIRDNDDNVLLGEKYRAYMEAKYLFEEVLIDIEAYKEEKIDSNIINKGK